MAKQKISRANGFVHDIETVAGLSSEPTNIRLLSDRSLYILQNLSLEDVTFLSRYGQILTDGFYIPVRSGDAEEGDVVDAVDLIRRDLNDMSVEQLLECICEATSALVGQGSVVGQEVEASPSDGTIAVGPGEQFPDQASYLDAKCNAANAIFDTVLGMVDWLDDNDVDLIAGLFGGVTSGLLVGIAISGPMGWAWALVGSLLAGLAGYIIRLNINFADLSAALDDTHTECVLALFNSSDAVTAEANFVAEVENGTPVITSAESGLLNLFLSSDVVNQLFSPRDDIGTYASPSPVDCGSGLLLSWDFDADVESWTFRDDSTANASATGSYDAVNEALSNAQIIVSGGSHRVTRAVSVSPALSQAIEPGYSVQVDHSGPSDGIVVFTTVTAIYSDASEEEITKPSYTSAGTIILTLTESKTLSSIEILTGRSNGSSTAGFSFTTKNYEVRVVGL